MEQRLGDLETQIERLTLALVRWREHEEHSQPLERRLEQLTGQCADILKQWTATSERHAQAVGELETRLTGWNDIETRLQRDASSRFQGLERTIEREWASLRHLHEEPVRELREHAETLTEISVNAAGSAQTGIERAEARLATLERDLHRRIDDLSRDIHMVLAEVRQNGAGALHSPASSWSLDEVTRLHHELRDGAGQNSASGLERSAHGFTRPGTPSVVDVGAEPPRADAMDGAAPAERGSPSDAGADRRETDRANEAQRADRVVWKSYAALAGVVVVVAIAAAFALAFYNTANEAAQRASEAQQRAERTASAANARIETARRDADTQISQARDAAAKAQVIGDVLAASDLVRFNLTGGDGAVRISGQLLWSRSRGMVFTASRMPAPPSGSIYQVWLLTAGDPVSAGTIVPDASGRVSFATDAAPNVPRPIVGVRVTAEPRPGSSAPTGVTVLGRVS